MKNDKKIKKKSLVALDIGTSSIKLAVGKRSSGKLNLKKLISLPTPDKAISNGYIRDEKSLINKLSEVVKVEKIKGKYSVITIKSSGIINREIILPYSNEKGAIKKILEYEMKQTLAIDLKEFVTQHQLIDDEIYIDNTRFSKIMVTAVKRELVDSYFSFIKKIGLKPYALDIHFNSINKFFKLYNDHVEELSDTIAVIDVGYNSTDIAIISDGAFQMSKTLNSGSNVLEYMLIDEFKVEFDRGGSISRMVVEDAEVFKKRVNDVVTTLVEEVANVIRYYISRDVSNDVTSIYITGGIVNQPEIREIIEERLDIPICKFDNIDKMIVGVDNLADSSSYFPVLGSMIRL